MIPIVILIALIVICTLLAIIAGGCIFLCGLGLQILDAITAEGFKSSESALETGFLPIYSFLKARFAYSRSWPNKYIPKH